MGKKPKKANEADTDTPGEDTAYSATPSTTPEVTVETVETVETTKDVPDKPVEVEKTWLEFQLLDAKEDGKEKPVANEPCEVLDGDQPLEGAPTKTDDKGVVRIKDKTAEELAGIKIRFPNRYDCEWKHLRFDDPPAPEGTTGD